MTRTLNDQIYNQYLDMLSLEISCTGYLDGNFDGPFIVNTEGNIINLIVDFDKLKKEKLCRKFLQIERSYAEVISRDHDALEQREFNVKIYAIVLIYSGNYQGHIYAWQSPLDKRYCFAMGIRNKIDSIFQKELNYVSHHLLEGFRKFTLAKDSEISMITSPKPIMGKILSELGFRCFAIPGKIIGDSINPPFPISFSNYEINKPIIETEIQFKFYDF